MWSASLKRRCFAHRIEVWSAARQLFHCHPTPTPFFACSRFLSWLASFTGSRELHALRHSRALCVRWPPKVPGGETSASRPQKKSACLSAFCKLFTFRFVGASPLSGEIFCVEKWGRNLHPLIVPQRRKGVAFDHALVMPGCF